MTSEEENDCCLGETENGLSQRSNTVLLTQQHFINKKVFQQGSIALHVFSNEKGFSWQEANT